MSALAIWVGDQQAAHLRHDGQEFELAYADTWQQHGGYAFSPHLPLGDITRGAAVKHFFSNLLPEGYALESMARAHQISKFDVFGMLRKAGRDCAGALVLIEPDEIPGDGLPQSSVTGNLYTPVSNDELHQRIADSRAHGVPLMFWKGKRRISLAGVQNKLGVYMNLDGSLMLPQDSAPTSHILKVGDVKHPGIVANEYFCMTLAQTLGLRVPDTTFRRLPEPVLLVQRYDRLWTADGGLIRTHQIDGCQALNLPPEQKYEEPHYEHAPSGATLADLMGLSSLCNTPAAARIKLLQWVFFNYLVGNSDAHAKNLSLLIHPTSHELHPQKTSQGMEVAPFYDIVCGTVYAYKDFAQYIGQETTIDLVTSADWATMAKSCSVQLVLLRKVASQMLSRLSQRLSKVTEMVTEQTNEPIIANIFHDITKRALFLQDSLLNKSRP
ncbi:MAG: hypothetical protein RL211_2424 [Pseudomonadota bacterium]|jgi:serine/threonine-protein kinase HipA